MADPKVVLLGDCIATGQNLIWLEILGDVNFSGDILENAEDKDREKKLKLWFLKNNKEKINFDNLNREIYKMKIKKEKSMSWVSKIPNCVNLAVAGETFQGMHKKIKRIIAENSKTSMVLITCFSKGHRCVVINHENQKFVVKRESELLHREQYVWPNKIYEKFINKVNYQETFGEKFQRRKNKKSFDLLVKLLDKHQIPYKFLLFRKYNRYLSDQYVDLSDMKLSYRTHDGEILSKKLSAQEDIARGVMDVIGQS